LPWFVIKCTCNEFAYLYYLWGKNEHLFTHNMTENTDTIGILIELLLYNRGQVPDSTGKTKLLFCAIWQNLLRDIK
jgi:hypothetical protein